MMPSDERDRTASDLCLKKGPLPAAYMMGDVCCGGNECIFWRVLACFEEIAEACENYEEKLTSSVSLK